MLPAAAATGGYRARTERVSVAAGGAEADGESGQGKISGDGRVVVFSSGAGNLIPGDSRKGGLFVKELRTGRMERVAVATDGTPADGSVRDAAVSGNGRYVVFSSDATNLVPGGNPTGSTEVYVRDRWTRRTEILIEDPKQSRVETSEPSISADGSRIGFKSTATNLIPQTSADKDLQARPRARVFYAHELRTGRTELAAHSLTGSKVAVLTDIVADDTNHTTDAFATDLRTGVTRRLSVAAGGAEADGMSYGHVAMSADNRYAFFTSAASNLVPGDTNGKEDVFVRDLRTGAMKRVNVASDGTQANEFTLNFGVDLSGRTAVFDSAAGNLVPKDTNCGSDVFLRHLR
ncbi:hypothetical protein B7P34_01610 [Streptosporangium nondiastaticum]|uniref:Protein tolB n=1 Tax=Streptosporangium nondiastaticum TaxID=35764 RepID=A0A9X7PJY6_9ACTN|nr:hypothetical protein B7P34_01610 [Streptosporangium nondiastaticum]